MKRRLWVGGWILVAALCIRKMLTLLDATDTTALDEVRARAKAEALMEPWGPFEMGGFEGCTDRDPDSCACATDAQPTCRNCEREIEPGELAWSRQWPCYDTLPLDHEGQEWDLISWHDDCERADHIGGAL